MLKAETVSAAVANGLGDMKIKRLPGVIPSLSNDAEFFPGMPKSWCYTFMINDEEAPTGRPAGALGWAGLANLFYWIDRRNGLGGYWATQILPFGDPVSFTGYMDFETAAYQSVAPRRPRRLLKQSGVELPSEDHVWWKGGGSALLDQVEQFLTGRDHSRRGFGRTLPFAGGPRV